ncbi:MAG: septum formation initiator family protein [Gammaproteobacteria bacterium]|nr:septum formation initiator family protein [Gammaproteobacteria bacterium]
MLLGLQYRLWLGEGGIRERIRLEQNVVVQEQRNRELEERNRKLAAEVGLLKAGIGVEERARHDLGMVGEGEVFCMLLEKRLTRGENLGDRSRRRRWSALRRAGSPNSISTSPASR